jgi:D-arabinitol 4-dehydrogenase
MNVEAAHAMCEATDPIAAYCADAVLWGELANDPRPIAAMRQAYQQVTKFIENHKS